MVEAQSFRVEEKDIPSMSKNQRGIPFDRWSIFLSNLMKSFCERKIALPVCTSKSLAIVNMPDCSSDILSFQSRGFQRYAETYHTMMLF